MSESVHFQRVSSLTFLHGKDRLTAVDACQEDV